MRAYIQQAFQADNFLQYEASEQQLVDRLLMNFYPDILAKAAFLDRPQSLKNLYRVVGLIEEKVSVAKERWQLEQDACGECWGGAEPWKVPRTAWQRQQRPGTVSARCWSCGQVGHYQRGCPQKIA